MTKTSKAKWGELCYGKKGMGTGQEGNKKWRRGNQAETGARGHADHADRSRTGRGPEKEPGRTRID